MTTISTKEHQELEIMLKIAQTYLKNMVKYAEKHDMKSLAIPDFYNKRIIEFDIELTEGLQISDDKLYDLMQFGMNGVRSMIVGTMQDLKLERLPVPVLKKFEEKWDWRKLFKSFIKET